MPLLGIDTGGTFTDFVLLTKSAGQVSTLKIHKVLSTPHAPEKAILQGIDELGLSESGRGDNEELIVVHGSTVATNAVLENKGVRTAFITNYGLRDLLTIGRQARRELYNLNPQLINPPVARDLCLETGGRLTADGEELEALSEDELAFLKSALEKLAPQAVAINLLFSWLDDEYEKRIAEIVPKGLFVSRSSAVLPEYREYERGITTWLNASVGPIVKGYLERLCKNLPQAKVSVMQSAGGTIEAKQAADQAVHLLLSGPAGGMAGVMYVGQLANEHRLLSFDMGGTSTDVSLIDVGIKGVTRGNKTVALQLTTEGHIGPYPVGVPMVDMHTIGAGGGSIARVDGGGLLQVGPESAGADPGPACYGKGGTEPTVSDANLVLGRLRGDAFLGGNMPLNEKAAQNAVASVAESMGLSVIAAAQGIIDVANENMARALRVMSVQRGLDPAELTLACFGGAGGLHVCALAESLGMKKALVPVHAGVLSALGMLVAPRARHLSRTINRLFTNIDEGDLEDEVITLAKEGRQSLVKEGFAEKDIELKTSVDVRYHGQSYVINLPWNNVRKTSEAFHAKHESLYGHRLKLKIELVNLRVQVQGPCPEISLSQDQQAKTKLTEGETLVQKATLAGINKPVSIYTRDSLSENEKISGPALITETISTTYIAPEWECVMDKHGSLLLTRTAR
jgi:N-methylhydantoinase A